jgi:hypothetical protein
MTNLIGKKCKVEVRGTEQWSVIRLTDYRYVDFDLLFPSGVLGVSEAAGGIKVAGNGTGLQKCPRSLLSVPVGP